MESLRVLFEEREIDVSLIRFSVQLSFLLSALSFLSACSTSFNAELTPTERKWMYAREKLARMNVELTNAEYQRRLQANDNEILTLFDEALFDRGKDDSSIPNNLQWASANGKIDIVKELLKKKVDVNAVHGGSKCPMGTALSYSAASGRLKIVRLLLENGADPNIPLIETPLEASERLGKEQIVKVLKKYGAVPRAALPGPQLEKKK